MPVKNSTLTWRWMEEVWNKGSEAAIDEMLHDDAVVHGIEGISEPGPSGFKTFYRSFREQFPQIHVEVEEVVSEEDHETGRHTVRATTANQQQVEFSGMTLSAYKIVRSSKPGTILISSACTSNWGSRWL